MWDRRGLLPVLSQGLFRSPITDAGFGATLSICSLIVARASATPTQIVMKRLLLSIVFALCAIGLSSAQEPEHLKFKGIPIEGSIDDFGRKLVAEGFSQIAKNAYKGKFMRSDCTVVLVAADNGMIWRVAIAFGDVKTWSTLRSSFEGYVDLYKEKYGQPTKITKTFTGYYADLVRSNPNVAMSAIDDDACNYNAYWKLKQGSIDMSIVKGKSYRSGAIIITYTDDTNKAVVRSADLDEI